MRSPPRRSHCSSYELAAGFPLRYAPWRVDDAPLSILHAHRHWELGVCHDGGGVFHLHHQVWDFRPGSAVVIPPECYHFAASNPGLSSAWTFLHCDVESLLAPGQAISLPRRALMLAPNHDGARLLSMLALRIPAALAGQGQSLCRSLITTLFLTLADESLGNNGDGELTSSEDPLAPALALIAAQYAEELSMGDLAAACGVSTATLNRWFHQRFQHSPRAHLMAHRLQRAAVLLRQTALPIAAIAKAVGMPAVSGFQRQFRRQFHHSPNHWRRQQE